MAVAVQKYIKNMAKSVTYTASDVLSTKFEYVKDFKNENQEVFKEVYSSVKDYRTTFARVKKTITNNKVMDAARVGYDSIMYSITTGDFYAKNKETEVIEKYGGNLMADLDIDDDDFNWDNEDLSTGDKVVATAIKKNSKIGTALTVEAIATTGKAQMDVSKENTMLLYTQNERLLNKLDGGFTNIMSFLKQNGEQTAKVQNQMNENLNKFMTNVDNNVTKLTKQMDELLEMQRNMYNPSKKDEKKRIGYDDIIGRNGVINIKEYMKNVKKQGFNTLNDMSGGALSMLFGDAIEGSNLLATFASTPFRAVMTTAVNKALGKKFDKAAAELNTTLEGLVPSIIAKLNAASKKEDSGIMGFLGKIFGIRDGAKESINTGAYNKGAIPFDGITKRAITDVIPYYLRKMTSVLTGEQEMVYDFSTGKWTGMRAVKANHSRTVNSANNGTADALVKILESNMGGRRLSNAFNSKSDYDRMMKTIESFAAKLQATGDYGSLTDLSSDERELKKMLDRVMNINDDSGKDRRRKTLSDGTVIDSGRGRSQISKISGILRQQRQAQNNSIKAINEGDSILRIIEAEGLASKNLKEYHGKSYVNSHGDFNQRHIQEMPMSQALVRAKDEYGVTLYQYLRDMGASLRFIKANSIHLGSLGSKNNKKNKKGKKISQDILTSSGGTGINYEEGKNEKYISEYYKNLEEENARKDNEKWNRDVQNAIDRAKQKGKTYSLATTTDYKAEGDNVSLARIMAQAEMETESNAIINYNKEQKEAEDKKWKRMASIIGEDKAKKLREASDKFESDKSLNENMKKVKDESFSSKLMMFTKYAGNKLDKPGDVMADTILKVDYWLQKMLYGNDIKEEDTKKGFFQHMKETVEKGFQGLKDVVSEAFGKLRDKITESKVYKSIKKFFVGEKDDEGIYQGGLFGNFMGGMQKGLRKNAHDVKEYAKQQALAAKNKIKNSLGIEDTSNESETTSTNENPIQLTPEQIKHQQRLDEVKNKIYQLKNKINSQKNYINEIKGYMQDCVDKMKTYSPNTNDRYSIEQFRNDQSEYIAYKEELLKEERVLKKLQKEYDNLIRKYNGMVKQANLMGLTNVKTMAVGGVNRTGKPFQSVLSAGEYLNGKLIPSTGIYTVPKGGVVVNPANASTRAKQATNERRYLNNIRRNAEANDKLTPTSEITEDTNKFAELMTNKDWRDLEDDKQRAEFLGSVASRGVIGGGLGLLVGGPLLGAAVGAASSLTKSTDAFSSLIFGSAVTENGKVQVDEKGNVIRQDDGLISKEIMKAVPDIKKFGLGGAIAGLITPLGPLGGILAGSALGFAKNSEIFQGSLFGEGGVFSDENIKKLKKGAKNMGIGAIIGAFTGPFGLVGNALLGATAGYVTSTDKFKDAILGEKIDPNDPDSKRQGGVLGAVKAELKPLKDFGRNLVDKIMDEIFGKKEGDKRKGGIFGAIKENMVEPIISGTKSVFQSLQNKVSDLAHLLGDAYKKYRAKTAGNGFLPGLIEKADKVSGGLIHGAGSVFKAATKPFRLIGDDGLGGMLKAGRIKKGQETSMTARERLMFRGKHKMLADDNFSESDKYMADASANDLAFLQALLSYDDNKGDVDNAKTTSYSYLGQQLRGDLSASDSKKILKMLRNDDFGGAERFVRTRKISDEAKKNVLKNIGLQKSKLSSYDKAYAEIKDKGGDVQKILNERGFNVDVKDPKAMRYLKKQLNRELAHKESGLTDEEIEFDKKREFWNDTLKPISMPLETMVDLLKKIYNEDKLNNEYNRLTMEFDRLVAEGNETEAEKVLNKAIDVENKLNGVKTDIKTISDKHQEEQEALKNKPPKNKLQVASEMKEVPERVKKVIQDGLKMFDIKVMRLLSNRTAIELDIDKWKEKNQDKELKGTIILTRTIGFVKFNKTYEFEVNYKFNISNNSIDINGVKQPESFEQARQDFGHEYVEVRMPREETGIWAKIPSMKLGDMVRNTIKLSGFFVAASIIPGGALAIGAIALAKKLNVGKKVKSVASKAMVRIKHNLGSHDIDMESKLQKRKEKRYSAEAKKALDKILSSDNLTPLNDISMEKYGIDYTALTNEQRVVVNDEFMNRYKNEKRSKQIFGHGLVGNVKALAGTLKSGVKNTVAGAIDKVKEKKLKAQEQNKFLDSLFTRLDKWKMKKDKKDVEGKKDSRLAKIIKWLFVGGIAAPIIVGFVKDKIMPAIHDKIQPWLKKAGEKLIGVKNQQTGEYEGGLVSGIVNPIRNFFKDKFQTISDWFHNTGKFNNENSGFKGLINNLKGVGIYMVDLWKSGMTTIINDFVPKAVETLVVNLIPLTGAILKGLANGIKALIFGDKKYNGQQDIDSIGANTLGSRGGNTSTIQASTNKYGFNNTVGGSISVSPVKSVALGWNNPQVVNSNPNIDVAKNPDGTETATNEHGETVSTVKISDNEMMYYGTNDSQQKLYMKRDGSDTKTYVRNNDGTYSPYSELQNVYDSKLYGNTGYDESIKKYEKSAKEANKDEVGYYNDDGLKSGTHRFLQAGLSAVTGNSKTRVNNLKGAGNLVSTLGKGMSKTGKFVSHIPLLGKLPGWAMRASGAGLKGAGKVTSIFGNAADVGNDLFHIIGNHIDAKRGLNLTDADDIVTKVSKNNETLSGKFKDYFSERISSAKNNKIGSKAESEAIEYVVKNNIYKDTLKDAMSKGLSRNEAKKLAKEAEEKAIEQFKNAYSEAIKKGAGKKAAKNIAKESLSNTSDDIIESVINKSTKKAAKEVAEDTVEKGAKTAASKIIENTAEKGAKTVAKEAVEETVEKGAKTAAKEIIEDVATDGNLISKLKKILSSFPKKITGALSDLFSNKTFKALVGDKICDKFLSKAGKKMAEEAAEKFCKEVAETCIEKGAKAGGKAAFRSVLSTVNTIPFAQIVSLVISIIMVVVDFVTGWNDAGNILQISNDKLTFTDKLMASMIRGLQSLLCSLPTVGIMFTGIFLLLNEQTVATIIINAFNLLVNFITGEDADVMKRREESKAEWEQFNQDRNTNLSFEQWNNREHATTWTKFKGNVSSGGWWLLGKDAQTTEDLKAADYKISAKSETVQDIKDKLADIIGYMWETRSDKIKKAKEVTRDQFMNTCTKVIDKIVILLNDVDDKKLEDVYDSACDMSGPVDWKLHGDDAFDDGWDNAKSYLKLPEDTKVNKTIRCVGAIASVFVKSCGGAGLKWKIISIVITEFGDLFRAVDDEQMKKIIEEQNKNISDVNNEYNGAANIDASTLLQNTSNQNTNDVIATNANANNKLSPISSLPGKANNIAQDNPINKLLLFFSNMINNSVGKMTGDFSQIEEIFSGLNNKNKRINDAIDALSLLPTDKKYWDIEIDNNSPFVSGLFKFVESMNRVVKAPFALAAASLGKGLHVVASAGSSSSSGNSNSSSGSSGNSNSSSGSSGSSSKGGFLSKLASGAKKLFTGAVSAVKSWFGFGKGDNEKSNTGFGDDPYHIYQRDFSGSYRTSGDSENQTIADSGCGPAAAASLLRMYGKKGDMNNAVNYALNNNYKEVDGGTYPQYFNDYLNKNGISTNSNADNNDVINSLINSKPVILMGRDANNSGKTPYGSKYSHYVVARGIDSNGNVIVEDSEDKNGSTRYSLADTLRNSSVRITTGNGKFGRGQSSVIGSYIGGVNNIVNSTISNIVSNTARTIAGYTGSSSSSNNNSSTQSNQSASTNGVEGSITPDTDVKTKCGYTAEQLKAAISAVHSGCSAEQFPEAAIAVENSKGVNALFTVSVAIAEHGWDGTVGINTTGANWGNWNVFNIQGSPNSSNGRWKDYDSLTDAFAGFGDLIMGSGYYGNGLTTPAKIGPRYCDESWASGVCNVADTIVSHISGSGKGKGILPTINKNFMSNINKAISYFTVKTLSNIGSDGSTSSNSQNSNTTNNSSANVDIDSATTIICGDSITFGLSRTSLGDRAMGLSSGTTDKNHTTEFGSYDSIFKSKSDIISGATDAIFFWGMNEVFTSMSPDDYFNQYQDSIDTILGYGGRNSSNTNIYILPVIWVPDNSGYGGSYNASKVEAFNEKYIKPFAQNKGYTFVDIYEDSKQVPHEAGNVHPSNYEKLYQIIKAHMSGESVDITESGSGRGSGRKGLESEADKIINKNNKSSHKIYGRGRANVSNFVGGEASHDNSYNRLRKKKKYGRGIWGRDGEENTTSEQTVDTSTDETTTETSDKNVETTSSSSSNSTNASGLINLLSKYSTALTKGIFGNFYDALYGSEADTSNNTNSGGYTGGTLTEGDKEANMKAMFSYMTAEGLSNNLTAGILGNIKGESGFDPHVIEGGSQGTITTDMSHGYGLIQWTGAAGRACLYNWCTANNCDPETLDGQTKWVVAQVKGINISDEANQANASMFNGETGQGTMSYNWSLFQSRGSLDTFNSYSIEQAVKLWLECAERPADMSGALSTRIEYAKEILAACTGGSGRGKDKAKDIINSRAKYNKYGRGIWGRDGEEDTSTTKTTSTDTSSTQTTDTETTTETNTETTSSSTSSSTANVGAKSLINKLSKYAKAGIKGVYGNFYDALYGSEVEESDGGNNIGGYTDGSGVIYAAAMVFEAMGRANPTFGYCSCCDRLFDLECRDGKKIDKVRPDCSGMMSAVAQYMGYYTYPGSAYTDTFFGYGYNVTYCWDTGFCDRDGNRSPDWEYLDFDPNDRRPGDMVIRNDGGHIDMYVFTDTNGKARGFNAGSGGKFPDGHCDSSGHGIEDSYNLAKYYLDNGNQLPTNDGSMGAWTIQDGEAARVIRYKGSGSGRGKGSSESNKNSTVAKTNIRKENIKKMPLSVQNRIAQIGKQGNPYIYTAEHNGRGILKSLDSVQQHTSNSTLFSGNTKRHSSSNTNSSVNNITNNSVSSYSGTNNNTSIDLNQLINLINVIANNSDKMDAILQLLGTIAVNTENTSTAITNKNSNPKNGLSALRSALDSNSSGIDIAKAVYQIAKS
jgi:hypothetical protein|nr:MAG TPA: peptidase [Caudoviricetes sp.]